MEYREACCVTLHQTNTPKTKPALQSSTTFLNWVIFIMFCQTRSLLNSVRCSTFFEWLKIFIKGRSPTMRHVSRTHRFALDWLFDRINLDPKIQITYVDTTLSIWLEEHRETCSERTQSRRSVEFSSVAKGCRKGREYDETRSGRRGPGTYEFPWKSQAYEETRRIRKLRHRRCWHTMATHISIYLLPTFCILRKFSRIWDKDTVSNQENTFITHVNSNNIVIW